MLGQKGLEILLENSTVKGEESERKSAFELCADLSENA